MNRTCKISTLALALMLGMGLTGCSVGPDYHKPDVITTPAFKEAKGWSQARPQDDLSKGPWWALYQDSELDKLLRQVVISNQNVAQYEANYRQAQALVQQAQASLFPSLSGNAGVTRKGTAQSTDNTYTAGLATSSWELDLWGKIRRGLEQYQASAQASEAELANITLSAQSSLAQYYFQLRVLDARIALYEQSIQAYERYVTVMGNRYRAGTESRAGLAQAQTLLESTRASRLDLQLQRAQLEHAIAVLTGQPPARFSLPAQPQLVLHIPTPPVTLPSQLLERRPDIAYAERNVAAANAAIGVAQAAYYPDLTLSASAGFESSVLQDLISLPSRTWSLGPSLSGTLLDFGATGAQVKQAEAAYDASVASYRQTVLEAFAEVEDYLVAVDTLQQQLAVQQRASEAAKESARVTLNQYKAGMIDYLDVATTQNTSLSQQQSVLSLQASLQVASVNLIVALGGNWQGLTTH
ncbi:efflux transporter outer membrane subunit [Pseudaeromonas paramecii]|uniref:Multidrug efflux RND transporter outer membrane subunit OpmB n=1 Tax=Pseudaeromonas paramecii TaxID=2138166 RepID=A0ABP8QIC4_9GAMM